MGVVGDRERVPAGPPQRLLLPRLRSGVRRHFRARHDAGGTNRLCLRTGPPRQRAGVAGTPERLLVLINAPANGDHHDYNAAEIERCATKTFGRSGPMRPDAGSPAGDNGGDHAFGIREAITRRPGGRCTARRCTGRWPRSAVRARGARLRAFIWRGAASTLGRDCRWRHSRAASRRRPFWRTRLRADGAEWRLRVVVSRRVERRRSPWPDDHRLHRQRVLALLRLGQAARAGRSGEPLRAERGAVWPSRKALVA